MRESEYRELLNKKTPQQLVDLIIKQSKENNVLKNDLKDMEGKLMEMEKEYNELEARAGKMIGHWDKPHRDIRRKDIDTDELAKRYVAGETAYKISKDTGIGQMTVISRLKRAGVYKGKEHNSK